MSAYARKAINQRERHQKIQNALKDNQYTMVQMNPVEFIEYVFSVKHLEGTNQSESVYWVDNILSRTGIISQKWEQYKARIKLGTTVIPISLDGATLGAIALEMKRSGDVFGKYSIKYYQGKPSIIFSGYSGLRKHLTGTKYLANNPKVISFGIGKTGVTKAIKSGFVVTVIISATFYGFEQMLNDKATWHDFVGGMAVDVSIAAAASGIAWGAVATYVGGTAAMAAVGPILAVVVVGTALAVMTTAFVDSDSLVKKMADGLREIEHNCESGLNNIRQEINQAERLYNSDPISFLYRLFGIPYFGNQSR